MQTLPHAPRCTTRSRVRAAYEGTAHCNDRLGSMELIEKERRRLLQSAARAFGLSGVALAAFCLALPGIIASFMAAAKVGTRAT